MKHFRYISLGAGVQSSALLIMSNKELHGCQKADVAIFADTQCEPPWVYEQLERLKKWSKIPIHVVTAGNLYQDVIDRHNGKKKRFAAIPAWTKMGQTATPLRRQCTREYKIEPIEKKVRELLGYKPRQRIKDSVIAMIGISWDEAKRAKDSRTPWITNKFPLLEACLKRTDCVKILEDEGMPIPKKSSCVICPYHSSEFWRTLKKDHGEQFKRAVEFDKAIRDMRMSGVMQPVYLHRSCKPLDEANFEENQMTFEWFGECEGMCGT